jgi:hypothetical protein
MSVNISFEVIGTTVEQYVYESNKNKTLGGYKNDFSKIWKRTKKLPGEPIL